MNAAGARAGTSKRTTSIDLLRGIVMIVMALDHARDFLGATPYEPTDLERTNVPLFFTRWITHYCAPVFVCLAGTAAWLSRASKSDAQLTRFLVSRGLWLAFLEVSVVAFCWSFDSRWSDETLGVIWAIGCSMVVLAAVIRVPVKAVGALGGAIVVGHNLLDHLHVSRPMGLHALWDVVHEQDFDLPTVRGVHFTVFYPLVPWVGVMMLGFALGAVFAPERGAIRDVQARSRDVFRIGLAATVAFVLVRASNLYGDPAPWTARGPAWTVESFLNCQKYPPSLCYVLMTLGPALMLLAAFDRSGIGDRSAVAKILVVYGRVPLFYYVLHIGLIHATAVLIVYARTGRLAWVTEWYGRDAVNLGLPVTYAIWASIVALLYPACRWFAGVKASEWGRRQVWLSYL